MSKPQSLQDIVEAKARLLLRDFEDQSATDQKNRAQAIEALCRAIGNLAGGSEMKPWEAMLLKELGGAEKSPHGPRPLASGQPESESESDNE